MKLKNNFTLILEVIVLVFFVIILYISKVTNSNFLENLTTNIISALIGAYAVVKMTNKQIDESKKLDFERRIIEHRPLLKYDFIPYGKYSKNVKHISTDLELGKQFNYNLEVENIGLDIVKKFSVEFKSDFYLEKELITYGMIKMNEKETVTFSFEKLKYGDYEIKNIITYQDVLGNWYSQDIYFKLRVYDQLIDITNVIVGDEKLIQKVNI